MNLCWTGSSLHDSLGLLSCLEKHQWSDVMLSRAESCVGGGGGGGCNMYISHLSRDLLHQTGHGCDLIT